MLGRQSVDQASAIRAAPAGYQVIALDSRIGAVAAAGNIVEIGRVTGTQADGVNGGIDKAEGAFAIGDRLLIDQGEIAGPSGRSEAGSAPASGASTVRTDVIVGVGFGGDVRRIPVSSGSFVAGRDDAGGFLITGNRYLIGRNSAAAIAPAGFRLPGAARAVGRQIRTADGSDIGIVGRVDIR